VEHPADQGKDAWEGPTRVFIPVGRDQAFAASRLAFVPGSRAASGRCPGAPWSPQSPFTVGTQGPPPRADADFVETSNSAATCGALLAAATSGPPAGASVRGGRTAADRPSRRPGIPFTIET
jgi:hypothetical protein